MWRRYLFVLTFAWWMGGLTFYALVVIPTAEHVLGNHREVGFITQQVTIWLNLSGFVPLVVLLGNLVADWGFANRWLRYGLTGSWVLMAISQIGLFVAHAWLTQILDIAHHRILHSGGFEIRHAVYEGIVTVQWGAALIHAWLTLTVWRNRDSALETRHAGLGGEALQTHQGL